jgi:hypothetical protein
MEDQISEHEARIGRHVEGIQFVVGKLKLVGGVICDEFIENPSDC